MKAVLYSCHQEVARLDVNELGEIWGKGADLNSEDLIMVVGADGKTVYWCDSIEFITEDNV